MDRKGVSQRHKVIGAKDIRKGVLFGVVFFATLGLIIGGHASYKSGALPFLKKDEKKVFTHINIERRSGPESVAQEPKGGTTNLIPFEPQMMDSPFKIMYPEKWHVREGYLGRGHARLYLTRDPVPEGKTSFKVGLGLDTVPAFFARRTDSWESQKLELVQTLEKMGADILASSDVEVSGHVGVRIDFASKILKGSVINLKIGPHLYSFTVKSRLEEYENYRELFEKMIESLTWQTVPRKSSLAHPDQPIDVTRAILDGKKYDVTLDGELRKDVHVAEVIKEVMQKGGSAHTLTPSKRGKQLKIIFDRRKWKMKVANESSNPQVFQYFLENEDDTNWTEVVTWHRLLGAADKFTPQIIADQISSVANPKMNIISQSNSDLVYDGFTEKGTRYELVRVIFGEDAIHTLYYASRDMNGFEAKKEEWLGLLNRANVTV